jgi:serine/threonine-protein kinase RsbT
MIGTMEESLPIVQESDIVKARQLARQAAAEMGFGTMDQSRVATAVSELARNVVRYATDGTGTVHVRRLDEDGRRGLEVVVEDEGPGIDDIELAMRQGFSSGTGLGLGLGGTKRLMDEMQIDSGPGRGTTVTIRKWLR